MGDSSMEFGKLLSDYEERRIDLNSFASADLLEESPGQRHYGPVGEAKFKNITLRIGNRPYATSVRRMYEEARRPLPDSLGVFDSYDIWLVRQAIGVIEDDGGRALKSLRVCTRFASAPSVTIIGLAPDTEMIKTAGGEFRCSSRVDIAGKFELDSEQLVAGSANSVLGHADSGVGLGLFFRSSFAVFTQRVSAIGEGADVAEWLFRKSSRPLVGGQVLECTVLTPRSVRRLRMTTSVRGAVSGFMGVPVGFVVAEIPLECDLGEAPAA